MKERFIKAAREVGWRIAPIIQKALPLALTLTVSANAFAGTFINNDAMKFSQTEKQAIEELAPKTVIAYAPHTTARQAASALHKELRRATVCLNKEESKNIRDEALDQFSSQFTIYIPTGITQKGAIASINNRLTIIPSALQLIATSNKVIVAHSTQNMREETVSVIETVKSDNLKSSHIEIAKKLGIEHLSKYLPDQLFDDLLLFATLHETAHAGDKDLFGGFFSRENDTPFKDSKMAEEYTSLKQEIYADISACEQMYQIRGNLDCVRFIAFWRAQNISSASTHQTYSEIAKWANNIEPGTINLPEQSPKEIIETYNIAFGDQATFQDVTLLALAPGRHGLITSISPPHLIGLAASLAKLLPEQKKLIDRRLDSYLKGKAELASFSSAAPTVTAEHRQLNPRNPTSMP